MTLARLLAILEANLARTITAEVNSFSEHYLPLVEAELNRRLRLNLLQSSYEYELVDEDEDPNKWQLPDDGDNDSVRQIISVTAHLSSGYSQHLNYQSHDVAKGDDYKHGNAQFYSISDKYLFTWPSQASNLSSVTVTVQQNIPPLYDNQDGTVLSTSHPDIYLAGLMAESYRFLQDYEREAYERQRFITLIEEANMADRMAYFAPASQTHLRRGASHH